MGKYDKKRGGFIVPVYIWKAMPVVTIVAGIALLCLIGGIVAHYVTQTTRGGNQIGAKDFYFTVDLLSATDGEPDENAIVTRDFDLYGAGQNTLTFSVQNFFDDLRVNAQNIPYTVSWKVTEGTTGAIAVTKEGTAVASGVSGTLTGESADADTYTVTVDDASDGARVEVTVASSEPYAKEMTLNINLYPQKYDVLYRVEDAPGGAYATLIVMAGVEVTTPNLVIDWSTVNASANVLQVDTTDTHILMGDGGATGTLTAPVTGSNYLKQATNSKTIAAGESIAIYFFKTDPSQDYSKPDTIVEAVNGKYTVVID